MVVAAAARPARARKRIRMSDALNDLRVALGEHARANESLAAHTTFRVGGPADLLAQAKRLDDWIAWVRLARAQHVPLFILGNGSNVLVGDRGIRGLVIANHCVDFYLEIDAADRGKLIVESGAPLPGIANRLARHGWAGLEWAIGVPGTVGGAIVGNAGAHGGSIADQVSAVTILDADGEVRELPKTELGFAYRTSRFKQAPGEMVLSAIFELRRDDPTVCIARMNQYTESRRRTQPTEPSVGSMFKNPPGRFAGQLIEQAGLKGARVGGVQVSQVHANFFVNRGGAMASDVIQLVEHVRARVQAKFSVALELEIQLVGDF